MAVKRKTKETGLTIKQRLFVDHYIVCMNGTQAAKLAGYEGEDYTLSNVATENLRKPLILREIDNRLKSYTMSANEVLIHLTDIARGDMADALNTQGFIDPLEAKRRGKSHLIKRFKRKTKTVTTTNEETGEYESEVLEDEHEIEMYDRLDALKTLAKFHALLIDRVRQEDWRTDILKLLQEGAITPEQLEAELGYDIARELVTTIQLPIYEERAD